MFAGDAQPFRPEFLTGEDQDFFRRMIDRGHVFVWCDEAVAYEVVPPVRWRRTFMLRRALLRGRISLLHPTFGLPRHRQVDRGGSRVCGGVAVRAGDGPIDDS